MAEATDEPSNPESALPDLPRPEIVPQRRWGLSLVWFVPIVALLVAASLFIRTVILIGPRIDIEFASADGIEPGKTDVRYKEVVIGRVEAVSLRGDRKRVIVTVRLDRAASGFAVADTLFWVVRPRIGAGGISGLGTLLSGAYIGSDAGSSPIRRDSFVGLEAPPFVLRGEPGAIFVLHADDLGSLEVGSPLLHRRTQVGRVVGYTLDPLRDQLSIRVFVEAPYQALVTTQTRFWNASGVDVRLNANGLTLNAQTLATVLAGGIAFETPPSRVKKGPAPDGSTFALFDNRKSALAPEDGTPVSVRMVFNQSVRGLADDAAVDFLGVEIGRVRSVSLQYDGKDRRFPVQVMADIYPLRLGAVRTALFNGNDSAAAGDIAVMQRLIQRGLSAQLRTGNLLTGQLYVALDLTDKPTHANAAIHDGVVDLPTAAGALDDLQPQIADIVHKLGKVPFDDIGTNLQNTLRSVNAAIAQLTPEAQKTLAEVQRTLNRAQASLQNLDRSISDPDAPLQHSVDGTLQELQRAARSLRVLTDYLQLHPEALLRGKPADPTIPANAKPP